MYKYQFASLPACHNEIDEIDVDALNVDKTMVRELGFDNWQIDKLTKTNWQLISCQL